MERMMQRLAPSDFVREHEDPAKTTYSRMAFVKRGLLATAASEKS
jgi:hypothetical protein